MRPTVRRRLDRATGPFAHESVVATYLGQVPGVPSRLVVVTLDAYQGEDWRAGFGLSRNTAAGS